MAKSDYLDPRWQKKRLQILERDDFCCVKCFDGDNTLHIHHLYYVPRRAPWEYPDWSLLTLCSDCHETSASDCRDDEGNYHQAEWEEQIEWLVGGRPAFYDSFPITLRDVAIAIAMARQCGAREGDVIRALLPAAKDLHESLKPEELHEA